MDSDLLINLPKLKTHGMTTMTLSVKNVFGCIPGKRKIQWHLRAGVNRHYFAHMLVELYGIIRPGLNVVDAVVGMEGEGPNAGNPRKIGLIIAGSDGIAVDSTICQVVGLPPRDVLTNRIGSGLGLGVSQPKDIEVVGEGLDEVRVRGFSLPRSMEPQWGLPGPLRWLLRNWLTAKPYVRRDLCKLCEVCVKGCPPGALAEVDERIDVDYSKCIRCFCCSEFCPEQAIDVRKGWPLRLFGKSS
jgi:NAD-dependent dihydropyrimidine dehydrogenase PreA subunit